MTQRSCSLPKLNRQTRHNTEHTSPSSARKINKDIHRAKWSMAPKCLLEGHEGKDILYLCINPGCQEPTRLVCETCFFKTHAKHNEEFLAIDEIKNGEIQRLRYWPFGQKFKKTFQFVTKHESYVSNMIQDVNTTFHGMALRILSSIDKIRLSLLKKIDNFYLKQTTKKHFCETAKTNLQKCFQLKKIRQTVRSLFSKEIKHQVFSEKMKDILNDKDTEKSRQIFYDYFMRAQKGNDMLFDKMSFLKKQNWIIEQIEEQKKTLRQTEIIVDEEQIGIQRLLPQTLAYLQKNAEGLYPLTFEKRLLADGSQYTGFEEKGVRTLIGMRKYPKTGFVYYGEWRIGAKNGYGVLENKKTGYRYSGAWKQDKKNGFGKQETFTSIYEGNYVGDKKQGFGIMAKDGVRYEITWKNDKMNGTGKKIEKNGQEVEIYYLNGLQSKARSGKVSTGVNLKELTKRFGSASVADKTRSN